MSLRSGSSRGGTWGGRGAGERGSRGLRPRLSHRSARRQTLSRGLRVSTLLLFTLRWGLEARGAHSGPPGPRNEASEKPGVRLHGRARRARLTERPRPRRPPLPASPQAWRWTPPIDGGCRQTGRGCRRRTPSPAPLPREGWFSRPRLPLQRAGATWPTSSGQTRPDSERPRAAAPSPPPPPLTPAEAVCMKVVSQ